MPVQTHAPTAFGRQLREARLAAGFPTLASAADKVGVRDVQICKWETRAKSPSWETVRKLVVALRLPLERFFPADLILEAAGRLSPAGK